jgi:hypothetical protein
VCFCRSLLVNVFPSVWLSLQLNCLLERCVLHCPTSAGLTIWQRRHMPRAPRFWGPRASSLLFFPEFFIPCWLFQCGAPKSPSPPENARPQTLFCTLFQCSSAGTKEPKVPRKRQAPELKIRGPRERDPKRFFCFLFQGGIQTARGPKESMVPKSETPK